MTRHYSNPDTADLPGLTKENVFSGYREQLSEEQLSALTRLAAKTFWDVVAKTESPLQGEMKAREVVRKHLCRIMKDSQPLPSQ